MPVLNRCEAAALLIAVTVLAGCARTDATGGKAVTTPSEYPPPGVAYVAPDPLPAVPPKLKQLDLVGRWGYASYQRIEDKDRTIAAAEKTCSTPYLIGEGPHGGVVMHLADQKEASELAIKGSHEGYDYIGPPGPPSGDQDREVSEFDGHVMLLRFVNPELASRYGISAYVRCSAASVDADTAAPEKTKPAGKKPARSTAAPKKKPDPDDT